MVAIVQCDNEIEVKSFCSKFLLFSFLLLYFAKYNLGNYRLICVIIFFVKFNFKVFSSIGQKLVGFKLKSVHRKAIMR